jgi:hypothetical protein
MTKEFVPYAEALALKELGFDEPCFAFYKENLLSGCKYPDNDAQFDLCTNSQMKEYLYSNKYASAPTFSQTFRFFREKYNLLSEIGLRDREDLSTWKFEITIIGKYEMKHNSISYNTHDEAESACLIKLIEICKNK